MYTGSETVEKARVYELLKAIDVQRRKAYGRRGYCSSHQCRELEDAKIQTLNLATQLVKEFLVYPQLELNMEVTE